MGMKQEILPPAVQDGEETDLRAEVSGIGGNGLKSGGAGGKQDFVQQRLVAQDQIVDLFGDGEDHVVVLTLIAAIQVTLSPDKQSRASSLVVRQQFSLPAFHPLRPGPVLTFRTVAVAAGVVGVSFFGAVAALLPIASERGGTARFDGVHQPELMERQVMPLTVPGSVDAEDAGHLEGGPVQAD
jgi:hypothetical protein